MGENPTIATPSMTISKAAKHLSLSVVQIRRAIKNGMFPNHYQLTEHANAPICIPLDDIEAFKRECAGMTDDGKYIYDQPFMYWREAAEELGVSEWTVKGLHDRGMFPSAYKETMSRFGRIRIPSSDVMSAKASAQSGAELLANGAVFVD
jgi:predicted DNA-binding transcriptional regulator AlpA